MVVSWCPQGGYELSTRQAPSLAAPDLGSHLQAHTPHSSCNMPQKQSAHGSSPTQARGECGGQRSCHASSTHFVQLCESSALPFPLFSFCSHDHLCSCCLWKGNFPSSAIPGPPFLSYSKCLSSLFCVSGFLPDTTGTVNWIANFPVARDVSSQWERQFPMQKNKVPLVVVFIIMWMYVC